MPETKGSKETLQPTITSLNLRERAVIPLWEREVEGVYSAMFYIRQKTRNREDNSLTSGDIFELHRLVMNDSLNPEKYGMLRETQVIIRSKVNGDLVEGSFRPPDPHFLSEYFNEFVSELGNKTSSLSIELPVEEVLETAAWAHMKFVEMHPFEDGNGRVARLLVDYIFSRSRFPVIKDWGSKRREYKSVVQQAFIKDDYKVFSDFLARKLDSRLFGIQLRLRNQTNLNGDNLKQYIADRRDEVAKLIPRTVGYAP